MKKGKKYSVIKIYQQLDWSEVPVLHIDNVLWTKDAGISAWGQLCCSGDALLVHLCAREKYIRARNKKPLSPVHEDSCLEFFFKPQNGGGYFNFEINPNGCLFVQFGTKRSDRVNITRADAAKYFDIQTSRTKGGWEAFYKIPLEFIRLFYPDFRFEGEFLANLYKCGDKTKKEHYLSWNPIDLQTPDFHCPQYFGNMVFTT